MNPSKPHPRTLKQLLQLIRQGKIKTKDAAAEYGCGPRHFNRLMLEAKVERPPGARALQDRAAAERKQRRQKAAKQVLEGTYTLEKAARLAGCSERTVSRYMKKATNE